MASSEFEKDMGGWELYRSYPDRDDDPTVEVHLKEKDTWLDGWMAEAFIDLHNGVAEAEVRAKYQEYIERAIEFYREYGQTS